MLNYSSKFFLAVLLFGQLAIASAQGPKELAGDSTVVPGMGYSEVLGLWGAPQEKTEQESKRMDVWRYDEQLVYFRQGKVIRTEDQLEKAMPQVQALPKPVQVKPKIDEPNAAQMESILSEIIGSTSR